MELPHLPLALLAPSGLCLLAAVLLRWRQQRLQALERSRWPGELERLATALADGSLNPQHFAVALEAACIGQRTRLRGAERELLEFSLALARAPGVDAQALLGQLGALLRARSSAAGAAATVCPWRWRALAGALPLLLSTAVLAWLARATPWLLDSARGLVLLAMLAGLQALGALLWWREAGRAACSGRC